MPYTAFVSYSYPAMPGHLAEGQVTNVKGDLTGAFDVQGASQSLPAARGSGAPRPKYMNDCGTGLSEAIFMYLGQPHCPGPRGVSNRRSPGSFTEVKAKNVEDYRRNQNLRRS